MSISPIAPKSLVQPISPLPSNSDEEQGVAYAKLLETPSATSSHSDTAGTPESKNLAEWDAFHKAFINNLEEDSNRQQANFRENMKMLWLEASSN